jgi:hypothetical protein
MSNYILCAHINLFNLYGRIILEDITDQNVSQGSAQFNIGNKRNGESLILAI